MICDRAWPLLWDMPGRVPKKAQNSSICTFEHINVDDSAIFARACNFKSIKFVLVLGEARLGAVNEVSKDA